MIDNKRVVAIIPARGGSKRLPRKNILPLAGKPLIAWSIDTAIRSRYIDNVIVSTEDDEIALIANQFGENISSLRPSELASDTASTESVILHELNKLEVAADIVLILQPTSPLRTTENIDEALKLFIDKDAYSIVSVTECEHSPQWSNILPENDSMENFIKPSLLKRSQDLDCFYRLNGALYIYDVATITKEAALTYNSRSFAYKMTKRASVDIDDIHDFELAEYYMFARESSV